MKTKHIFLAVFLFSTAVTGYSQPANDDPANAIPLTVGGLGQCNFTTYDNTGATFNASVIGSVGTQCDPTMMWANGDIWFTLQVPASGWCRVNIFPVNVTRKDYGVGVYSTAGGPPTNGIFFPPPSNFSPGCFRCFITADTVDDGINNLTPLYIYPWDNVAGQTVYIRLWTLDPPGFGTATPYEGPIDICAYEPETGHVPNVSFQTMSVQHMVQLLFANNQCDSVFNVQFDGQYESFGGMANGDTLGFTRGMLLCTGSVGRVRGNGINDRSNDVFNTITCPELNALVSGGVDGDGAILEFDYIPNSDTIWFRYIFGSEEYNDFVNLGVNDVFGFFVTGPRPGGGTYNAENIAIIGTPSIPVCINNVNNGQNRFTSTGPCENCLYYVDNVDGEYPVSWDGFTVPLIARLDVIPCETYHIKLAIKDVGDRFYDSGILFEEKSFIPTGSALVQHYDSAGNHTNYIQEGCGMNYFVINRPDTLNFSSPFTVSWGLGGNATMGVDYDLLPAVVTIPPFQMSDTIWYSAFTDAITESEYITYSVSGGCLCNSTTVTDTIFITETVPLQATISPPSTVCAGTPVTLSTTVNPAIPSTSVSYLWSNGGTSSSITVNPGTTTTYTVTITATCTPSEVLQTTVTINSGVVPGIISDPDTVCINQQTEINFSGTQVSGTTYTWNFGGGNPATGSGPGPHFISWTNPGTYSVSLTTDNGGCQADSTISILVSSGPVTNFTVQNILCNGLCSGSITGSVSSFQYQWSNSQSGNAITNLCAGNYQVTVSNQYGCASVHNFTIQEPTQLIANASSTPVSCYGGNNGTSSVVASGGTPPYTYLWNDSDHQTSSQATQLTQNTYTVTVTDQNLCSVTAATSVNQPAGPVQISLTATNPVCHGSMNGMVNLTVNGGTPGYQYSWTPSGTQQDLINIGAGTYAVTVTDANGCSETGTTILTNPGILTISIATTNLSCNNINDGSAEVTIVNGTTSPYTYQWSGGQFGSIISGLAEGSYSVTVSDANGCTTTGQAAIDTPEPLVISISAPGSICLGQDYPILASVTGGTFPYSIIWSNGATGNPINISPTSLTNYSAYATDSRNCISNTASTSIGVYPPLTIDAFTNTDSVCPGEPIYVTASIMGGDGGPYTILNQFGDIMTLPIIVYPASSGGLMLTVHDGCNYTATDQVQLAVYPSPQFAFYPDVTQGCEPLAVNFTLAGGNLEYTYNWNFGDFSNYSQAAQPAHTYDEDGLFDVSLTVTSEHNCVTTVTIQDLIRVYPKPETAFEADPAVASILNPNISLINYTSLAESYIWSFGDGDSSALMNPVHQYDREGNYNIVLMAISDHGCIDTAELIVTVQPEFTFFAPTAFSPDMDGTNDQFFITGLGISEEDFTLNIYDRWGNKIWETDYFDTEIHCSARWDGTTSGNNFVPAGTYTWMVIYRDGNSIKHEKAGPVTVIR